MGEHQSQTTGQGPGGVKYDGCGSTTSVSSGNSLRSSVGIGLTGKAAALVKLKKGFRRCLATL
jgi:hypothetical protein